MFGLSSDKQVISLDWDPRSLRVVQWRVRKGSARVVRSLSTTVGDGVQVRDAQSMGDFIRSVLSQARIKTSAAIVDISRDQAVLNTMSLPAVGLNDLAGMVQLQIAKELPFALSDAVVDFAVAEHQSEGASVDVLVAAIRREVLDFHKAVCARAGLKLERVGLRPYANMVAINDMLDGQTHQRVMFVDIGPRLMEIGILRDGALVFSRAAMVSLDAGLEDLGSGAAVVPAEAELEIEVEPVVSTPEPEQDRQQRIVENLLVEITRSSEAYRSTDPGAQFDCIVVGGSSGVEEDVAAQLSVRFGTEAQLFRPWSLLDADTHVGENPAAFAAAIGLGIGHAAQGRLHFDFLHPKKPMDAAARRRQQLLRGGAAVAAVALIAVLTYLVGIAPRRAEVARLDAEIKQVDRTLKRLQEASRITGQVQTWQAAQLIWPDELIHVVEVFPDSAEDAYLETLDMEMKDGEISFKMRARDRATITELIGELGKLTRADSANQSSPRFIIDNDGSKSTNDARYPWEATLHLKSARIAEMEEASP